MSLPLQIIIIVAFIALIVVLFFESKDYLTWAVFLVLIIGLATAIFLPLDEEETIGIIFAIDWEVVVFLFCLFIIVEILNEHHVLHQVAIAIVNKYRYKPRRMFYVLCVSSTLIATVIEDLSVAMIFVPIVIKACKKIELSPVPYLFGITICINLASTLTPFGSAENVIIANHFGLSLHWHLIYLGVYFIVATIITLVLLDKFVLSKYLKDYDPHAVQDHLPHKKNTDKYLKQDIESLAGNKPKSDDLTKEEHHAYYNARYHELKEKIFEESDSEVVLPLSEEILLFFKEMDETFQPAIKNPQNYYRNLIGLGVFVILLITIPSIVIAGVIGLLLFLFLNPVLDHHGNKTPSLSYYLKKIDAKLIYFFILLFITVYFMQLAGITVFIENLVDSWADHNILFVAIEIMLITSLLSGFLDDAPVTILFLPIISDLIKKLGGNSNALFIGFTLGINLGGNFLPQGAACDMMTLELARKNDVKEFTYKRLTIIGGLFALLHILLGIVYLVIFTRFFM
jgi:Na+/H+ antiporter NhaD/arsenite permease-like protein